MNSQNLQAKLVYNGSMNDEYLSEYLLVKDETTIGRMGDIELCVHDLVEYIGEGYDEKGVEKVMRVSRDHARILRNKERFVLEDMGSKTGTYVNGVKLGEPQPEPWKVRFCHSENYYTVREPQIRERNKGKAELKEGDIISLGQEMFGDKHQFIFRIE